MNAKREPFLPIEDVFYPDGNLVVVGTLQSGPIKVEEAIEIVTQAGLHAAGTIEKLESYHKAIPQASAGDYVGIHIRTSTALPKFSLQAGDALYRRGEVPAELPKAPNDLVKPISAAAQPINSIPQPIDAVPKTFFGVPKLLNDELKPLFAEPLTLKLEPLKSLKPEAPIPITIEPAPLPAEVVELAKALNSGKLYHGPTLRPQLTVPGGWFAPKAGKNGLAKAWSNGYTFITPRDEAGMGSLKIANGSGSDALLKMVFATPGRKLPEGTLCRMAYICANSTVELQGIGPGSYRLFFCTGTHWDKAHRGFTQSVSAKEFVEPIEFEHVYKLDGTLQTTRNEVTLHPVPGGKARTTRMDQAAFDRLG